MAKEKITYVCSACGHTEPRWMGKCPKCEEWNTMEETKPISKAPGRTSSSNITVQSGRKIKDVTCDKDERIITGISEFDRVAGGGLVRDSITILSAPPGTGKSTLSIMLADKMLELGLKVLYASGEESASQIKSRATRLKLKHIDEMYIADQSNLDFVIQEIEKYDIDFIILDSVQTFYLNEFLPSRPGNPTQVIECASAIRDICKRSDRPRASIIIGQMTKDDELAGSRTLEHLVDTYMRLDGDSDETLRILQAVKNRFGNTGETGFFNMTELGLETIENPSEYFITKRKADVVGVANTTIKEGNRVIVAEVESLVSKSFNTFASRISETIRKDQLNVLASIIEKRGNHVLCDKDIVIKATGGLKLKEPGNNLAIIMAILSSKIEKIIPGTYVFIGDVGLTGEIKKVPNLEIRIKELERLGYKKIFIAPCSINKKQFKDVELIECNTLLNVINSVWPDN